MCVCVQNVAAVSGRLERLPKTCSLQPAPHAALDEVAARPVSGVVLLSDGTSADAPSRRALQRLRSERIPVFVVPIGSPDPVSDLAIASVRAPAAGFINDRMPVTVDIDRLGSGATSGAWVELVDRDTGEVLERKRAEATDQSVTLVTQPGEPGDASWLVRLVPDEPDLLLCDCPGLVFPTVGLGLGLGLG